MPPRSDASSVVWSACHLVIIDGALAPITRSQWRLRAFHGDDCSRPADIEHLLNLAHTRELPVRFRPPSDLVLGAAKDELSRCQAVCL